MAFLVLTSICTKPHSVVVSTVLVAATALLCVYSIAYVETDTPIRHMVEYGAVFVLCEMVVVQEMIGTTEYDVKLACHFVMLGILSTSRLLTALRRHNTA